MVSRSRAVEVSPNRGYLILRTLGGMAAPSQDEWWEKVLLILDSRNVNSAEIKTKGRVTGVPATRVQLPLASCDVASNG